jgi:hypothetical protein
VSHNTAPCRAVQRGVEEHFMQQKYNKFKYNKIQKSKHYSNDSDEAVLSYDIII